jgi:hypothetical protein
MSKKNNILLIQARKMSAAQKNNVNSGSAAH